MQKIQKIKNKTDIKYQQNIKTTVMFSELAASCLAGICLLTLLSCLTKCQTFSVTFHEADEDNLLLQGLRDHPLSS